MDDLISRQALCEYALNQKDKSVTPNDIMRFPSAQPELIRCKDCKYSDTFPFDSDADMPMKCLGIRYGGVYPYWYCEHAERREDG